MICTCKQVIIMDHGGMAEVKVGVQRKGKGRGAVGYNYHYNSYQLRAAYSKRHALGLWRNPTN